MVPVHNYAEGVVRLLKFVENNYASIFGQDNFKVILINSHSDEKTCKVLETFKNFPWVSIYHSTVKGSLKDALWTGWKKRNREFVPDVVHISETDAVPTLKAFKQMLYVYFEEEDKRVGSVSPMYTWHGHNCYPTHRHWSTDPLYKRHPQYGIIRDVGHPGVPFLYSLWRPNLLENINQSAFPPFISLDSKFGNYVHGLGYKHLRVTSASIDHFGGGKKSSTKEWKNYRRSGVKIRRR